MDSNKNNGSGRTGNLNKPASPHKPNRRQVSEGQHRAGRFLRCGRSQRGSSACHESKRQREEDGRTDRVRRTLPIRHVQTLPSLRASLPGRVWPHFPRAHAAAGFGRRSSAAGNCTCTSHQSPLAPIAPPLCRYTQFHLDIAGFEPVVSEQSVSSNIFWNCSRSERLPEARSYS